MEEDLYMQKTLGARAVRMTFCKAACDIGAASEVLRSVRLYHKDSQRVLKVRAFLHDLSRKPQIDKV